MSQKKLPKKLISRQIAMHGRRSLRFPSLEETGCHKRPLLVFTAEYGNFQNISGMLMQRNEEMLQNNAY